MTATCFTVEDCSAPWSGFCWKIAEPGLWGLMQEPAFLQTIKPPRKPVQRKRAFLSLLES